MLKELHFFNANGIAEPIRYILYYTKQTFEDVRHDFITWPDKKFKTSLPYGKLPVYKEGDRTLNQSLAIAKYLARGTDLIPVDPWDQAILESFVFTLYDFWSKIETYVFENDRDMKYQRKKKLLEKKINYYFARFERHLQEHGGFIIGKLSWADFVLCGLVEGTNLFLGIELEKEYPAVAAVVEKIRNLPGVKEHIAARGPYKLPIKIKEYKELQILDYPNL